MKKYPKKIKITTNSLITIQTLVSDYDLVQFTIQKLNLNYKIIITTIQHYPKKTTFNNLQIKLILYQQ